MKWFLLSVAVFVGSMALFAAIPTSTLIWARNLMVQPLEVFRAGTRPAMDPSGGFTRPMHDGGNPPEIRWRETIQADVAGRARVIDGDTMMADRDVHDVATRRLDGTRSWCSKMGGGISGVLHGGVVLGPRIDARGLPARGLEIHFVVRIVPRRRCKPPAKPPVATCVEERPSPTGGWNSAGA